MVIKDELVTCKAAIESLVKRESKKAVNQPPTTVFGLKQVTCPDFSG